MTIDPKKPTPGCAYLRLLTVVKGQRVWVWERSGGGRLPGGRYSRRHIRLPAVPVDGLPGVSVAVEWRAIGRGA